MGREGLKGMYRSGAQIIRKSLRSRPRYAMKAQEYVVGCGGRPVGGEVDLAGRKARWLLESSVEVHTSSVASIEPQRSGVSAKNITAHSLTFALHLPIGLTLSSPLEATSHAMSSWLPESHRLQLAITAVASGCLAATAVIGLQNAKRWYTIHDLKGSIPDLGSKHDVEKVCRNPTG